MKSAFLNVKKVSSGVKNLFGKVLTPTLQMGKLRLNSQRFSCYVQKHLCSFQTEAKMSDACMFTQPNVLEKAPRTTPPSFVFLFLRASILALKNRAFCGRPFARLHNGNN